VISYIGDHNLQNLGVLIRVAAVKDLPGVAINIVPALSYQVCRPQAESFEVRPSGEAS